MKEPRRYDEVEDGVLNVTTAIAVPLISAMLLVLSSKTGDITIRLLGRIYSLSEILFLHWAVWLGATFIAALGALGMSRSRKVKAVAGAAIIGSITAFLSFLLYPVWGPYFV